MYLPSILTLAAIQIYQEENATEGQQTVEKGLRLFPGNKDLLQLQLDCKAVAQNLGHMINAGFSASKYLGDYTHLPLR